MIDFDKTMIDFDRKEYKSIKSISLKANTNIKVTSKFINGKVLMFAKILPKSFAYDMNDVFCFPNEEVKMIYDKYDIITCHLYINLTSMDSCLCFYISSAKRDVTSKRAMV